MRAGSGGVTPAGTPCEIVNQIHSDIVRVLQQPDIKGRLSVDGAEAHEGAEMTQAVPYKEGMWAVSPYNFDADVNAGMHFTPDSRANP